jgi:hypothetical protein
MTSSVSVIFDSRLYFLLFSAIFHQKTDKKIHDMSSAINEIDMEFEEIKDVNIETIGSLSQITRPCPIKQISCFSLFIFSSFFSCTDATSVINLSSLSSRYFRTFDLAALICFIIDLWSDQTGTICGHHGVENDIQCIHLYHIMRMNTALRGQNTGYTFWSLPDLIGISKSAIY